jgi:ABC-type glutathione transport system ATPase component
MRLLNPDSGALHFDQIDMLSLSSAELKNVRSKIQMVFQDPYASLNPRMTVFETLAEPLLLHKKCEKNALNDRINILLQEVGLDAVASRKYPHEFSGGQRQRIAIARALACEPQIIVADEPVSALDVTIQAQILDLLLRLNREKGLTMLFISHDLAVVRYLCDRVAVMKQGEIVEEGKSEMVFASPQHEYTKKLLSAIPTI